VTLLGRLRRPPSLALIAALVAALGASAILAAVALVLVTAHELEQASHPTRSFARLRQAVLASTLLDREALLAPAPEHDEMIARSHTEHAAVTASLRAALADPALPDRERRLLTALVPLWEERRRLSEELLDRFSPPERLTPGDRPQRLALSEKVSNAIRAFSMPLEAVIFGFEQETREMAAALELAAIVVSIVGLALLATAAFLARSMLILPLRQLLAAEASVARGRLDVRVATGGPTELRELAFGFNEMVSSLRARADEVKQKQELLTGRERALHVRNKELAAANAELDAFAYAASHDLRAPLRGIESMARFLWEDVGEKLDPEARDKLDRIRRASRRLHQLIDSLLEVARAGRELGAVEEVDLADCIHEAIDALAGPIHDAAATVVVGPEFPSVQGDRTRLVQVFQNLVGNAVKYSSRTDRKPLVEIGSRLEDEGGVVAVFVRDNGIGIPEHQHQRIFQLFRRLHREGEYEGTGVGLSIVQRIVNAHQGEVSVESSPGRGSCFTVRLPMRRAAARIHKEAA
jgi:signal transduction histidine kinase